MNSYTNNDTTHSPWHLYAGTLATIFLLCNCASPSLQIPSFERPSTAPISRAITAIRSEHNKAKSAIGATSTDLYQILEACPQAKAIIVQAQLALSQALDAVASAEAATAQAEGARDQLDTQLKQQTDKANALARNYNQSATQIDALKTSRHSWVKRFWMASGLLVLAGLWIFKKPLLLMAGGIGI